MDKNWFNWWGSSCIPGSYIEKLFGTVTGLKETKTEMFTTVKPEGKKQKNEIEVHTPNCQHKPKFENHENQLKP